MHASICCGAVFNTVDGLLNKLPHMAAALLILEASDEMNLESLVDCR